MIETDKSPLNEVKEVFLKIIKWIAIGLLGLLTFKHFSTKSSSKNS